MPFYCFSLTVKATFLDASFKFHSICILETTFYKSFAVGLISVVIFSPSSLSDLCWRRPYKLSKPIYIFSSLSDVSIRRRYKVLIYILCGYCCINMGLKRVSILCLSNSAQKLVFNKKILTQSAFHLPSISRPNVFAYFLRALTLVKFYFHVENLLSQQ